MLACQLFNINGGLQKSDVQPQPETTLFSAVPETVAVHGLITKIPYWS
jgi:hypothetical protein